MDRPREGENDIRDASPGRWRDVLLQAARDLWNSNVLEWSASLAFYAVLSLFPLLIASMVLASYLVDPGWATEQAVSLLGQFLPQGQAEIEEIVTVAIEERRRVGLISFVLLLLTGRRILGGLAKGLNLVSDVDIQDDTVKRRVVIEFALALGLGVLVVLALAAQPLIDLAWGTARVVPGSDGPVVAVVSGVIHVLMLLAIFTLIYGYVPRGERLWRAVAIGAAVATALFLLAQGVFAVLIDVIWENLSLIYGPLAYAVLLLTWSWYVALVTLIGGAVASHVKVMVIEHHSAAEAGREHVRP